MNTDKIIAESIAKEYAPKNHSSLYALKKLDRKAKLPSEIFTYTFGIITSLVFGLGMCLSMSVIGGGTAFHKAVGIAVGLVGLAGMGLNYPLYRKIMQKGKEKYSFEIIELAGKICDK